MSEYDEILVEMLKPTPAGRSAWTHPAMYHLIEIAKGLIDTEHYEQQVVTGDQDPEYARGIIELLTEFAGFPLGDYEPREAIARAIGIKEHGLRAEDQRR